MPQAVAMAAAKALISWGIKVAIAKAVAVFAVNVLVNVAVSSAMQMAASALSKKKNAGSRNLLDPEQLNRLVTSTLAARQIVYGEVGLAGQNVFRHVHEDREWISLVNVLADGGQEEEHEDIDFLVEGVSVSFDGSGDATGGFAGVMKRRFYGGAPSQTADAQLITDSDGRWTSAHRLRGMCYEVWSLKLSDQEKFPNGIPEKISVIKGRRVYDRRLDSTAGGSGSHRLNDESTWTWSDNAALCADDFIRGVYVAGKKIAGLGLRESLRDADWTDASATVSDDEEWTINGAISAEVDPWETLKSFELHMAGRIVTRRGKMAIIAGSDWPSVVTLTEDDLGGPLSIEPFKRWRDARNVGIGTFRDPDANWEAVETAPIVVDDWVTEDNGEEFERPVALPFVTDRIQATKLVKIDLFRERAPRSINATWKLRAGLAHEGDIVTVNWPSYGIGEEYEVMTRTKNVAGFVTLGLRIRESISWADAEAGDPPNYGLIDRNNLMPPTPDTGDWTATGVTLSSSSGSQPAILVAGSYPDWIDGVRYYYRETGTTDWHYCTAGPADRIHIKGLVPNKGYDVLIRYRFGRRLSPGLTKTATTPNAMKAVTAGVSDSITGQGALATQSATTPTQTGLAEMNNLVKDPLFVDSAYWDLSSGVSFSVSSQITATLNAPRGIVHIGTGQASGAKTVAQNVSAQLCPVEPGAYYRVRLGSRHFTGFTGLAALQIYWRDQAGVHISATTLNGSDYRTVALGSSTTVAWDNIVTAPANARFAYFLISVFWSTTLTNASQVYFANPYMLRASSLGVNVTRETGVVVTDADAITNIGTASGITGQTAWATSAMNVARLQYITDGGILNDWRGLPTNALAGLALARSGASLTAVGPTSITVAAVTITLAGGTISLPSATISSLANSTKYYVFRDLTNSTYSTTTSFSTAASRCADNTGRWLFIGDATTQSSGGGGGGWTPPGGGVLP